MCGINGIVLTSGRVEREVLERMRDVIQHRGPDDCGILLDGNAGLGHRRLSIVDVAGGHQPMPNEDGTLHLVYNGEIYNHADFREGLEARGHTYRTHCDTETILHLYEEKGVACVEDLRGMFAFAIWDSRRRELFIARDRLGVKPLYYVHRDDGSLFFASEIKSLLEARAVKPELNCRALPDYLANHGTSGDETLFEGVRRLPPGHTLLWRDGRVKVEKYWDVSYTPKDGGGVRAKSDEEYVAEWSELFRTSVRLRLMADVPLGMFLSGGIDSSAIAAVMSRMVSEPIKTFSVAFAEREANELSYARLVAEAFKTDHHEVIVSPQEFFEALPRLVWHEDEPLAHPSSVALYFVSRLASRHVKVVLTGEGSDEMLAGYERYYKTVLQLRFGPRYHNLMPGALRRAVEGRVRALPAASRVRHKLARTFLCLEPDVESLYFDNFAVFTSAMQRELLTPDARERAGSSLDPYADMRRWFESADADSLLDRMLYADTKTYLHELLMKQDQMSMAASIESRVPFLDHKLVEYTARMPERMKLRRGLNTKYVLRRAMKGVLPEAIITRGKMGFPVPVGKWFRGEFRHVLDEYVTGERAAARGVFEPRFVRALVARHLAGEDHTERLWSLVNFEMWQRRFIDGETPGGPREELEVAASVK
ncbi:MAG TPA: asparagine synthase (glutamine-hydrolyzing) [Pyrinomonadaceae bacterium]|jgi:asparagine synthase (glutamine-hydrolysing)|nr:asparagine synthase (glutamine-hydrolyzing) [Pyrinomonadaceae bacterium]